MRYDKNIPGSSNVNPNNDPLRAQSSFFVDKPPCLKPLFSLSSITWNQAGYACPPLVDVDIHDRLRRGEPDIWLVAEQEASRGTHNLGSRLAELDLSTGEKKYTVAQSLQKTTYTVWLGAIRSTLLYKRSVGVDSPQLVKTNNFFHRNGQAKLFANKGIQSVLFKYNGIFINFMSGHLDSGSDATRAYELRKAIPLMNYVETGDFIT